MDTYHKANFTNRKYNKRSTGNFARTPFHTSCSARYNVLHFCFSGDDGEVFTNVKVKLLCGEVCASHK